MTTPWATLARAVVGLFLLSLWIFPSHLFAQQGAGVLIGNIRDAATKNPIPDAVVTVTSPSLQGEQMVVTDVAGFFRIPELPPGIYAIRVENQSYRVHKRDGIALRSGATLRLNAEMLPESLR